MASASASAGSRLPGAVTFIPEERLPAVREAFRMFDTAGAGDIALDELAGVLRALRYTVNAEELDWFSEKHGRDGRITYPEVLEVVGTVHNRKRGVKAVLAAFKVSEPFLLLAQARRRSRPCLGRAPRLHHQAAMARCGA